MNSPFMVSLSGQSKPFVVSLSNHENALRQAQGERGNGKQDEFLMNSPFMVSLSK